MLDDVVNKYNSTVQRTIKMKPIGITNDYYMEFNGIAFNKDSMELHSMKLHSSKKILNLKVVIMLEFQNIKTFLLKDILQIVQKKFLLLIKLKIQFLGLIILII